MSMIREIVNAALWQGLDPLATPAGSRAATLSGGEKQPHRIEEQLGLDSLLSTLLSRNRTGQLPRIVVVAGAGDGSTTAGIARLFRERKHDGVVVAVDTWLGTWEDWCSNGTSPQRRDDFAGSASRMRQTFIERVHSEGLAKYVVPLPLDDVNAAALLKRQRVATDVIYLSFRVGRVDVESQLELWWPLLPAAGRMIADLDFRNEHRFLQTKQALEIFAVGRGSPFEDAGTLARVVKATESSVTVHEQPHLLRQLTAVPTTLDYDGEFGPELALFLPYVTWLSRAGLLRESRVVIYAGMRCFYDHLQCLELVEKHSPRRYIVPEERLACLPVKSELLYDVAELSPFHAFPNLRQKFQQRPLAPAFDAAPKPLLVIHNKYAVEWNREPINHFGPDLLDGLFSALEREFTIVYIRHGMTPEPPSYSRDDNFHLPFDDRSVLNCHPNVMRFDDVYADFMRNGGAADINAFKNALYSRCYHFISSQGGGAAHISFFSGSLLMVLHRYGREERLAYGNGPYGFVSNPAPLRIICLNDDEILRGVRLFQGSSVMDGRAMIASGLDSLQQELSPWTLERRRNGKWSR